MRPEALLKLLVSVKNQTLYPDEILIIDGSLNEATQDTLKQNAFPNLKYFLVSQEYRGLTKQRNFGIANTVADTEIICFLDDDTILEPDYFEEIVKTYTIYPDALGVGGYINNDDVWERLGENDKPTVNEFAYDGWKKKEGSRFVLRKKLGLDSDVQPGFLPDFSHGRSVRFLPHSGKIYQVEQLLVQQDHQEHQEQLWSL